MSTRRWVTASAASGGNARSGPSSTSIEKPCTDDQARNSASVGVPRHDPGGDELVESISVSSWNGVLPFGPAAVARPDARGRPEPRTPCGTGRVPVSRTARMPCRWPSGDRAPTEAESPSGTRAYSSSIAVAVGLSGVATPRRAARRDRRSGGTPRWGRRRRDGSPRAARRHPVRPRARVRCLPRAAPDAGLRGGTGSVPGSVHSGVSHGTSLMDQLALRRCLQCMTVWTL